MEHAVGAPVVVVAVAPAVDRYLWVERFELGAVHRPSRVLARVGGKAINAARVLRQLGAAVTVAVPAPAAHAAELRALGIDVEAVPVDGELRQTSTVISEADGLTTEIYEPSLPLGDGCWEALSATTTAAIRRGAAAVVVSGSRPIGEVGRAALATLTRAAGLAAIPVYVDGRPGTVNAVLAAADVAEIVVKVNAAEAAELANGARSASAPHLLAAAVVGAGATAAVVTTGESGAVFAERSPAGSGLRTITVAGPSRPGPSPGGSGDAFLAGLVAGRLRDLALDQALELARRCAEANAAQPLAGDLGDAVL